MSNVYTLDELEKKTQHLLKAEPEIAKACMVRALLNGGHVLLRDRAVTLAELIYEELGRNKFDVAFGVLYENDTEQLLPCYIGYNDGLKELPLFILVCQPSGHAELYPGVCPAEKLAKKRGKAA